MRWVLRLIAAAFVLAVGMGSAQQAGAKLALVIGVGAYDRDAAQQTAGGFITPGALANAVRDSELVAAALESQGFAVTKVANPDKRTMLAAVSAFGRAVTAAGPDAVGVFYFAGHGAQGRPALERDIDNYLIPLGADLLTETDLDSEALGLSRISEMLRPGERGAMVLILDACRDFALPASTTRGMTTRGLAEARAAPGTIIAYATSPGRTALDGPAGQNGFYARALAREVRAAQGARIEDVFISVRNSVLTDTHQTQLPWENGSLRRAVTLGTTPTPSANQPQPAMPREFDDCDGAGSCPLMVEIPSGTFRMGREPGQRTGYMYMGSEEPQHQVAIRGFAIGKFEVTRDEWEACRKEGKCRQPSGAFAGSFGRHPISNVSWHDAIEYTVWLSARTGKRYRLPSEAEWEYAARAGARTRFAWGDDAGGSCLVANGADATLARENRSSLPEGASTCDDGHANPALVGQLLPNSFGLHDMYGNLWEWVEDCAHLSYTGAPRDGAAWTAPPCDSRVIRGGSFVSPVLDLRAANRAFADPAGSGLATGFRVARSL